MKLTDEDFPRILSGRMTTLDDLEAVRRIIAQNPKASRYQISREVCLVWGWYKPDGGLKDMRVRTVLLNLDKAGLIKLPPSRFVNVSQLNPPLRTPAGEPGSPIVKPVQELLPLRFEIVTAKKDAPLWREFIERYHYLGNARLAGAQIRYLVYSKETPIAALGFSAAAWNVRERELWIRWNLEQRRKNLQLIVNNSRFLILPWVKSKNLASKLLSMAARQLPRDWQTIYGYTPVLLETYVDQGRFRGTSYKAANWFLVGCTQGRGRQNRSHKGKLPLKSIYLFPLRKDCRRILRKKHVPD
jgi:hypothetical protein